MSGASRKQLAVYAIVERKDADKPSIRLEVSVAFANRDGSINLHLRRLPRRHQPAAGARAARRGGVPQRQHSRRPAGGAAVTARALLVAAALLAGARAKKPLVPGERIDLNRAVLVELMRLAGVGKKRAQSIAAHRAQHPFRCAEEVTA